MIPKPSLVTEPDESVVLEEVLRLAGVLVLVLPLLLEDGLLVSLLSVFVRRDSAEDVDFFRADSWRS